MKFKLAIFDFDGTLADSFPWFVRVFNDVADKYSFKRINADEVETYRTYDARNMIKHVGLPMWKVPFVTRHVRKRMADEIEQIPLFPGIGEMMQRLVDSGVIISLVSSNSTDNIKHVLGAETANLVHYYDCGASVFGKEAKIRKVLGKSGVSPSQTILIGDELRDLHAARAEKVAFGAVSWGYTNPEAFVNESPEKIFSEVSEIAEFITAD